MRFSASLGSGGAIVVAAWIASASSAANSDNDIVSMFGARSTSTISSSHALHFCSRLIAETEHQSGVAPMISVTSGGFVTGPNVGVIGHAPGLVPFGSLDLDRPVPHSNQLAPGSVNVVRNWARHARPHGPAH